MRVGLIGSSLKHSISPAFQQAAFDDAGLDVQYEKWEVTADELETVASWLRDSACLGANVTIPHKQAMLRFLDRTHQTVRAVGAVNTIVRDGDELAGYNTDVAGFVRAVRDDGGMELAGHRVVVIGAGGAARAVVAGCLLGGSMEVTVSARRPEQSAALVRDLAATRLSTRSTRLRSLVLDSSELAEATSQADLIVNATPIGMVHHSDDVELPLAVETLSAGQLVCDLIYNPPETALLQEAAQRGARTLNGLPMLVYQGAAAFELWTQRSAPIELMRQKALEALGV